MNCLKFSVVVILNKGACVFAINSPARCIIKFMAFKKHCNLFFFFGLTSKKKKQFEKEHGLLLDLCNNPAYAPQNSISVVFRPIPFSGLTPNDGSEPKKVAA